MANIFFGQFLRLLERLFRLGLNNCIPALCILFLGSQPNRRSLALWHIDNAYKDTLTSTFILAIVYMVDLPYYFWLIAALLHIVYGFDYTVPFPTLASLLSEILKIF